MTLDYTLMDSIVLNRYFSEPVRKATLVDEENSCRRIILFDPAFSEENGRLTFETRISIRLGKTIFSKCLSPIAWEGYLVFYLEPSIDPGTWLMSFSVTESKLLTLTGRPARIAGIAWTFAKDHVYEFIHSMAMDLAPPVDNLKNFLTPLFADMDAGQALEMVGSIKPGTITVDREGLKLSHNLIIPDDLLNRPTPPEHALSEEEIDAFVAIWEEWDTLLVSILLSLSDQPLILEERQVLMDVLLENRYTFIQELTQPGTKSDFVRQQFLEAWSGLRPIFRRHLETGGSGVSLMGYLGFFTASDALVSLDTMGPGLGIEISRDGFVRLVRLLLNDQVPAPLAGMQTNDRLRSLLGLPPDSDISSPQENQTRYHSNILTIAAAIISDLLTAREATAAEDNPAADYKEMISRWMFNPDRFDAYLSDVRSLMTRAAASALEKSKLPDKHRSIYKETVLASAWQESCFRQYILSKTGAPDYLRSYDNSSVGIMQINERVWKGLYDIRKLRWDIRYNAAAGCEILDIYFNRYALRYMKNLKNASSWTGDQLAGSVYAMYNGGPREFKRYVKRYERKRFYKSDKLFRAKLGWVKASEWQNLDKCL